MLRAGSAAPQRPGVQITPGPPRPEARGAGQGVPLHPRGGPPPSEVLRVRSQNDSEGDPSHSARAFLRSASAMARARSVITSHRLSDIH